MTDTIAFVKTRETACNANPASAVSAFSDYQRSNQDCLNNGFRVMLNHQLRLTNQRLLHVPIVTLPSIFIPRRDVDKTNDPHTLRKFLEEEASLDQANWCDRVDFPILMMASLVRSLPSTSQHHHLNWCLARLQYKPWVMISSVRDNTGAQSGIWPLDKFLKVGFQMSDLSPVSISSNATNRSPI